MLNENVNIHTVINSICLIVLNRMDKITINQEKGEVT